MDKWAAINLALSLTSVSLALVGIWLTAKGVKVMAQAQRVRHLSETLAVMWQLRQGVFVCLAYTYALIRQPRLTELRGRALEELLLGLSSFAEQKERFSEETKDAAAQIAKTLEVAEKALHSGAYKEAIAHLSEAAKILAEMVGRVHRALDEALRR